MVAGKVIRKRSLDEIPQVRVDHSFVFGISTKLSHNSASELVLFSGALVKPATKARAQVDRDEL